MPKLAGWDDVEKAQARADYLADASVSVQELADEYGVSRTAMLRALAGVTRPRGGVVRATLSTEQMLRMRASGLTLEYIAKQAGITQSGVHRRLTRYNQNRGRRNEHVNEG